MFVSQILRNVSESFVVHIWLLTQPPPLIMPRTFTTNSTKLHVTLQTGNTKDHQCFFAAEHICRLDMVTLIELH